MKMFIYMHRRTNGHMINFLLTECGGRAGLENIWLSVRAQIIRNVTTRKDKTIKNVSKKQELIKGYVIYSLNVQCLF